MNGEFKGIVLAGGTGSRFFPVTSHISKQLLPVYNKPMIYYPISILMLAGIRDVLIITKPSELCLFKKLIGDGSNFGIKITYAVQHEPRGLADALIVGEEFIDGQNTLMVLGDNLFYGHGIRPFLRKIMVEFAGACAVGFRVKDPSKYGVVEFSPTGLPLKIEEKPQNPNSNLALTGLYFFDGKASSLARKLEMSSRGELEITDLLSVYLKMDALAVKTLNRGYAWFDTGNPSDMLKAAQFVETIEQRQGESIACLEEIAYDQGWISIEEVRMAANRFLNSDYGDYLKSILSQSI